MANIKYLEQDLLRLDSDNTVIPYSQGTFNISVIGGSGSGNYVWKILPGSGRIVTYNDEVEYRSSEPSVTFVYKESGTATLTVYKEGSAISADESYIQSKTLSINLLLTEKDIKIVVSPESITYDFGRGYNISDFTITHPDLSNSEYNNVLSTKPTKYVPYSITYVPYSTTESYDNTFYRFDVFSKASNGGYNNGVQYHRNDNGSWTIKGTPLDSGVSYYNLIVSDSKFPDYLFTNSRYLYRTSVANEPVTTEMVIYFPDSTTTIVDLSNEPYTYIKETACGFILRFKVTGQIDSNLAFRLYSLKNRYVDDEDTDKIYYVSASGGVVSNSSSVDKKYNKDIQYKSAEFNFVKDIEYSIYNRASTRKCTVTGLKSKYLPKTDIIFTVTAKPNHYFEDGWKDGNICLASDVYDYTTWGRWWADEDVDICTGVGDSDLDNAFFRIRSPKPGVTPIIYEDVPFNRMSAKYDEKGRLIEGTYWIKMPVDNAEILIKLTELVTDLDTQVWPYDDCRYSATASGSTYELIFRDKSYADAVLFCYYAKGIYLGGDSTKLFASPYEDSWYKYRFYRLFPKPGQGSVVMSRYLTRGDMIKSLRRIAQVEKFENDSDWILYSQSELDNVISRQPDNYIEIKAKKSNCPSAVVSNYAGYPIRLLNKNYVSSNIFYPYQSNYDTIYYTTRSIVARNDTGEFFSTWTMDNNRGVTFADETAISDFLSNARDIPDYSWCAWAGIIDRPTSWISLNFNPYGFVDYKEACSTLWKYAKFRQLDIPTDPYYTPPSDLNSEFLSTPSCFWALSNGFTTGYFAPYSWTTDRGSNVPIQVESNVDRAEWAYMLSKFCQQYVW